MKAASFRIAAGHRMVPLIDWYLFLFDIAGVQRLRFHGRLTYGAIKKRLLRMRGAPQPPDVLLAADLIEDRTRILELDTLLATIRSQLDLIWSDPAFPWCDARHPGTCIAPEALPWRLREEARFLTGDYNPVPWRDTLPPIADHFAHLSTANPGLIAFTETPEKAEADVQTPIKPGRYLARFYPDLAAHRVRDIQESMPRQAALHFATTADDIERIYTTGPTSCMSHKADHFDGPCHPVRVYGDSDLQLAYVKNKLGQPTARALVWLEKKRYGRVYGHESLLVQQLEREGFREGSLFGARIRRIPLARCEQSVVMPYLDGDHSFDELDEVWLTIGGPYGAESTNGVAEIKATTYCERCDDSVGEDDVSAVGDQQWCNSCCDQYAFISGHSDGQFSIEEECEVVACNRHGRRFTQSWSKAERDEDATYCEGSDQWYATGQFKFVEFANGETWVDWYFAEHGKAQADNDCEPLAREGGRAAA